MNRFCTAARSVTLALGAGASGIACPREGTFSTDLDPVVNAGLWGKGRCEQETTV